MENLKYYIALGAPPIRTPATGDEPFMRPEVGFNPSWFYEFCGIDFSEKWHTDVGFRLKSHETMRREIRKRFPGYNIGEALQDEPYDLLTGIYGIGILDSIFNRPLQYSRSQWPVPTGAKLTDDDILSLKAPDLSNNTFFMNILDQIDRIYRYTGCVRGFLNWQGNLNTAFRFRGNSVFLDLMDQTGPVNHLLDVISDTFIQGVKMLYTKQREYGQRYDFSTIANCTVNMVGPEVYTSGLLKYDQKIASEFPIIGIHNCAWTVTPYLDIYSQIPNVAYIDMGIDSDLNKAREVFPEARRNCLYKSIDLKNKTNQEIRNDFKYIAENLAPCDVGMPDIECDVPDEKIMFTMDLCKEFSENSQ
ncbi:hypothetical protein GF407_14815 [candidate division KSB1 bacterium]|nr:hypothetical protein [candidate division KSB1 bacterium]